MKQEWKEDVSRIHRNIAKQRLGCLHLILFCVSPTPTPGKYWLGEMIQKYWIDQNCTKRQSIAPPQFSGPSPTHFSLEPTFKLVCQWQSWLYISNHVVFSPIRNQRSMNTVEINFIIVFTFSFMKTNMVKIYSWETTLLLSEALSFIMRKTSFPPALDY